jgi:putative endonuclease
MSYPPAMVGSVGGATREVRRPVVGRAGEQATLEHYRRRGYRLMARNWRCPAGELDLVLSRGSLVVFCEVKTRTGDRLGGGYEAVTWRKRAKLRQLAELFLGLGRHRPSAVRFDVASVFVPARGPPVIDLFEDAF